MQWLMNRHARFSIFFAKNPNGAQLFFRAAIWKYNLANGYTLPKLPSNGPSDPFSWSGDELTRRNIRLFLILKK